MRKVQLKHPLGWVLFPPLNFTLQLLNMPSDIGHCTRDISKLAGKPMPADNKTLRKFEKEGVKRITAYSIIAYLLENMGGVDSEATVFSLANSDFRKQIRNSMHRGCGIEWMSMLAGLDYSTDLGFPRTRQFLQKRFDAENNLFKVEPNDEERIEHVHRIYSENLLINEFCQSAMQGENTSKADRLRGNKEFIGKYVVDFYFWLLAYIEKDFADEIYNKVSLTPEECRTVDNGAIRHFLPKVENGKHIRSIALLFDRWRTVYSLGIDSFKCK